MVLGSLRSECFLYPQSHVAAFENFISNPWKPVLYALGFGLATHLIIALGVQKGIERAAKVMMPLFLNPGAVRSLFRPMDSLFPPGSSLEEISENSVFAERSMILPVWGLNPNI